jgi:hypothetical protein
VRLTGCAPSRAGRVTRPVYLQYHHQQWDALCFMAGERKGAGARLSSHAAHCHGAGEHE